MRIACNFLFFLAALFAAPSVLAARAGVPIQAYEDLPITSADGKPLSADQIRKAIISAGATRQWVASVQPGNVVRLTYSPRTHVAVVDVVFSTKSYSIRYSSSTNLGYGQEQGKTVIHPNYNKWINTLRQAIDTALRSA